MKRISSLDLGHDPYLGAIGSQLLNHLLWRICFAAVTVTFVVGCSVLHRPHRDLVCEADTQSCLAADRAPALADIYTKTSMRGDNALACSRTAGRLSWEPNWCTGSASHSTPYRLAVVEFDDFGDVWSESQVTQAIELLRSLKDKQVLFVAFVHGWKHNAREGDSNFQSFRRIVRSLATEDLCAGLGSRASADGCAVFGLYVSWRGDPIGVRYLNELSFFDRKGAARRSSEVPANKLFISLMGELAQMDKHRLFSGPRLAKNRAVQDIATGASRTVLIGHSFGGRFLESAMAQSVIGRQEAFQRIGVSTRLNAMIESVNHGATSLDELEGFIEETKRSLTSALDEHARAQDRYLAVRGQLASEVLSNEELQERLGRAYGSAPYASVRQSIVNWWSDDSDLKIQFSEIRKQAMSCAADAEDPVAKSSTHRILQELDRIEDLVEQGLKSTSGKFLTPGIDSIKCENGNLLAIPGTEIVQQFRHFRAKLSGSQELLLGEVKTNKSCTIHLVDDLIDEPFWPAGLDRSYLVNTFAEQEAELSDWLARVESSVAQVCSNDLLEQKYASEVDLLQDRLQAISKQVVRSVEYSERVSSAIGRQLEGLQASLDLLLVDSIEVLRPPVDVALMINPATEGIRGEQLAGALAQISLDSISALGNVTSSGPIITQAAGWSDFPTASLFASAVTLQRAAARSAQPRPDYTGGYLDFGSQATLSKQPLPQIGTAITHCASASPKFPDSSDGARAELFAAAFMEAASNSNALSFGHGEFEVLGHTVNMTLQRCAVPDHLTPEEACGLPRAIECIDREGVERSPIWVVAGDETFISGHNDVFGEAVGGLSGALLRSSLTRNLTCDGAHESSVCGLQGKLFDLARRKEALMNEASKLHEMANSLGERGHRYRSGSVGVM